MQDNPENQSIIHFPHNFFKLLQNHTMLSLLDKSSGDTILWSFKFHLIGPWKWCSKQVKKIVKYIKDFCATLEGNKWCKQSEVHVADKLHKFMLMDKYNCDFLVDVALGDHVMCWSHGSQPQGLESATMDWCEGGFTFSDLMTIIFEIQYIHANSCEGGARLYEAQYASCGRSGFHLRRRGDFFFVCVCLTTILPRRSNL